MWVILPLIVFCFDMATNASGMAASAFVYDEVMRSAVGYDAPSPSALEYDSASASFANENGNPAPRNGAFAGFAEFLAAEGGVQSELASAEENLGVVPDGKTVAADAFGRRTLSGWTDTQGFLPSSQQVNDVMAKANEIGFQFKSHIFDNGVPGRYFASHAEPQLSLNSGTFMVSKDMCSSCRSFMSARSVAEGTTFIVQDPTRIWTFSPTSTSWMWK